MTKVIITTQDHKFTLEGDEYKYFKIIENFMEDIDTEECEFPLTNLNMDHEVVENVLKIIRSADMTKSCDEYSTKDICQIMTFANFMQMDHTDKNLLEACAKNIANRIRGKSSEEIREIFQ